VLIVSSRFAMFSALLQNPGEQQTVESRPLSQVSSRQISSFTFCNSWTIWINASVLFENWNAI